MAIAVNFLLFVFMFCSSVKVLWILKKHQQNVLAIMLIMFFVNTFTGVECYATAPQTSHKC
jgi:hypothetical protein